MMSHHIQHTMQMKWGKSREVFPSSTVSGMVERVKRNPNKELQCRNKVPQAALCLKAQFSMHSTLSARKLFEAEIMNIFFFCIFD